MNDHPQIEELVELARGGASTARTPRLLDHLEVCADCARHYAVIYLVRTGARIERSRRRRRALGVLAASIVAVAATVILWPGGLGSDAALADLATTETLPESYLRLRFPGPMPAASDRFLYDLRRGLGDLVAGNYRLAIQTLGPLHQRHPDDAEVATYLGVSRYLTGDGSADTIALLQAGTTHYQLTTRELAYWYLANLRLRDNELEPAIALLESLEPRPDGGRYQRRAWETLRRLRTQHPPS